MGPTKADGTKPGVKVGAGGAGGAGGASGGKKVASSPLVSKKLGSTSSQEAAKTRTGLNRSNSSAR